jgi:hypothetical protein
MNQVDFTLITAMALDDGVCSCATNSLVARAFLASRVPIAIAPFEIPVHRRSKKYIGGQTCAEVN